MGKSAKNNISSRIAVIIMSVLLAVFAAGVIFRMVDLGYLNITGRTIPVYDEAPDFKLTERSGQPFSKSDLLGQVWIADFIFTRCPGQCPIMNSKMIPLTEELPRVKFVSFTSDPEHDTPEVFAEYAERIGAKPDQWFFLSGNKESINYAASGFKFPRINTPMDHSNYFVLVDKKGRIRGYYDSDEPDRLKTLRKDARALL